MKKTDYVIYYISDPKCENAISDGICYYLHKKRSCQKRENYMRKYCYKQYTGCKPNLKGNKTNMLVCL